MSNMDWFTISLTLCSITLQFIPSLSYTYNLEFNFASGSNLNLWYAFEEYAGPTAPWHYLGPVTAGIHNVSFDTDLELDSGLYRLYLGAYSSGSYDTLTITSIEYTHSGANYDPSSPFDWICDTTGSASDSDSGSEPESTTTPGCCVVYFGFFFNTDVDQVTSIPCDDDEAYNFMTYRDGIIPTTEPTLPPTPDAYHLLNITATASFTSNFLQIVIKLKANPSINAIDYDTIKIDINELNCDGIFDSETYEKLTSHALCQWDDVTSLSANILITLSGYSTISIDDELIIKNNSFYYLYKIPCTTGVDCTTIEQEQWTDSIEIDKINFADNYVTPMIVIDDEPNSIGICDDLVLDARSSYNLGMFTFVFCVCYYSLLIFFCIFFVVVIVLQPFWMTGRQTRVQCAMCIVISFFFVLHLRPSFFLCFCLFDVVGLSRNICGFFFDLN